MTRAERRKQLRADVRTMRALGVLRWGNVWLGPPPQNLDKDVELTPEQIRQREQVLAQRRHDTLFASSSIKPLLRPPTEAKVDEDNARLARVAGGRK